MNAWPTPRPPPPPQGQRRGSSTLPPPTLTHIGRTDRGDRGARGIAGLRWRSLLSVVVSALKILPWKPSGTRASSGTRWEDWRLKRPGLVATGSDTPHPIPLAFSCSPPFFFSLVALIVSPHARACTRSHTRPAWSSSARSASSRVAQARGLSRALGREGRGGGDRGERAKRQRPISPGLRPLPPFLSWPLLLLRRCVLQRCVSWVAGASERIGARREAECEKGEGEERSGQEHLP